MKPNSSQRNSNPAYLRSLIARSGLSQREAARRIGISPRLMQYYLAPDRVKERREAPYAVQYALEQLAH